MTSPLRASPGKDGVHIGLVSEPDPVAQTGARRAVLWRLDHGLMSHDEARTVLDVLGLLPAPTTDDPEETS